MVDSFHESSEMSAWLGQRHHYFDEISLLFETTQQSLGPRYVVWNVGELSRITRLYQPYATHPLFLDNLHFEHFVKSVNLKSRLNYLTKSSKWRLSKKKGWVACAWSKWCFQKMTRCQACATHPLFLDNLPPLGRTFRQTCQPQFQVGIFDEMAEIEIV